MILVRDSFRVKFGKKKDALALMKEGEKTRRTVNAAPQRLLADVTGEF